MAGQWAYLYRAADQHGQVIDVLLPMRRDLAAARRFFTRGDAQWHDPYRSRPTARPFTRMSSMN
jgi:transposase-like protein